MSCLGIHDPKRPNKYIHSCGGMSNSHCPKGYLLSSQPKKGKTCAFGKRKQTGRCFKAENAYSALPKDLLKCCNGTTPGHECKPGYCSSTSSQTKCLDNVKSYCSVSNRMFKDDECVKYGKKHPKILSDLKVNFCKKNISAPVCIDFCKSGDFPCKTWLPNLCKTKMDKGYCKIHARAQPGFDSVVSTFCSTHPNDPFCACSSHHNSIKSLPENTLDEKILKVNPQCYLKACSSDVAYKNFSQRDIVGNKCPQVNICNQSLTSAAIDGGKISNINMSCSQNTTSKETTESTPAPAPAPTPAPTPAPASTPTTTTDPIPQLSEPSNAESDTKGLNSIKVWVEENPGMAIFVLLIIIISIFYLQKKITYGK